jgi:hypothetical protein
MHHDDQQILIWVRARVQEFVDHLRRRHAADPRAAILFRKLRDVQLLDSEESRPRAGSWKNGKFKHSVGTLYVAPRDLGGRARSRSSLLRTVVHELAHATRVKEPGEAGHSPQWKQAWLWFLEIATQELGWAVDIKCAECTFYGLCDRSQCPKCNWLQTLCRPYAGAPRARERADQP